ncbi:MAG: dihydrofolate reductase family protein [Gammaproteobacteria bacterium]
MRELAILTFMTLDGVVQAPRRGDEDPSDGFRHGGWAAPHWDAVRAHVQREAMATPYELLLGCKTYELFASHFPDEDDDHPMNDATKFVATTTLSTLGWKNSIRLAGDVTAEVARLKSQDGLPLQVHSSAHLIQTLFAHDLIDEYRLWTFPVLVGSGKRLFAGGCVPARLKLVKAETGPTGVTMSIYGRAVSI